MKSPETNLLKAAKPLPKSFYLRSATTVARELLGKGLVIQSGRSVLAAEIVETEAYLGKEDPASHAFRGPTKRSWPMFEEGGTCYVYLIYGVHFCINVVTGKKGLGEAVLIRAGSPITEVTTKMNGPGKLTQTLGINMKYNGVRFDRSDFKLIDLKKRFSKSSIVTTPRIGISQAKERLFRYCVKGSPWLSRKG